MWSGSAAWSCACERLCCCSHRRPRLSPDPLGSLLLSQAAFVAAHHGVWSVQPLPRARCLHTAAVQCGRAVRRGTVSTAVRVSRAASELQDRRTALRSDSRLVRLARPAGPTLPPSHSCDCRPFALSPASPSHLSLSLRLLLSSVLTAASTSLQPFAQSSARREHNRRGCTREHGRRLSRVVLAG